MADLEARRTVKGTPDRREVSRVALLRKLYDALATPQRFEDLQRALGVSKRSMYFLLEDLEARGVALARLGSNREGAQGVRWVRV